MTTTKIKCMCELENCEARVEISEHNFLYVYDTGGELVFTSVLLPSPIAKAIRDVCKVMEDNDVDY